jgi:hypothetical protein
VPHPDASQSAAAWGSLFSSLGVAKAARSSHIRLAH